ncbi:MAG: amidohydrolase family protein [Flavisolibacter sp.]
MRLLLFLLLACTSSKAQIMVRNTTVVDVINKKHLPGHDVFIDNGNISAIGKKLKQIATQEINGEGKYLVPGFVDAHVHFSQSGGLYTRPDAIDLRKYRPYNEEIQWTHNNMEGLLRRYLSIGVTSVIDVGSTINFLQQRDSFINKSYAPSVYMTGPLLTTWEPEVFKQLGKDEPFSEMKTKEDAIRYVEQQLPYHPDFIKIWFIVSGRNTDSLARQLLPIVQAVIDEAHRHQLKVAVHATERVTASYAVQAGADYLVHSVDDEPLDDAFVKLLQSKKTVLSPTLVVMGNYNKVFGQTYTVTAEDYQYAHPAPLRSMLDMQGLSDTSLVKLYKNYVDRNSTAAGRQNSIMRSNMKKLLDGGVTLATGTDAGNIGTHHASSYFDELSAMKEAGMNLWQLLEASTINGAKSIGKEKEFGSITKGKRADLLLLSKNPLEDLSNWQEIEWVINKGVALQPDSLVQLTPVELVDQQLLAYNAHNLEAFLAPYDEAVEIYRFPAQLISKGKSEMRKQYQFLKTTPGLYCRLLGRMVQGNMVIDHEEVWGFGDKPFYGIAIYEIKNGKITKVYFPE